MEIDRDRICSEEDLEFLDFLGKNLARSWSFKTCRAHNVLQLLNLNG